MPEEDRTEETRNANREVYVVSEHQGGENQFIYRSLQKRTVI